MFYDFKHGAPRSARALTSTLSAARRRCSTPPPEIGVNALRRQLTLNPLLTKTTRREKDKMEFVKVVDTAADEFELSLERFRYRKKEVSVFGVILQKPF